jgi:4-hydroxy-tetrahydrodipicolinate synthase
VWNKSHPNANLPNIFYSFVHESKIKILFFKYHYFMKNAFKNPLSGIIPPLVTPLKGNDTLDVESLERLIEHLIAGGVHGLFVLGTTGEEQSLSYRLRQEMIREACRINNGRLPLLACITDTSLVESIKLANVAAECGASGVVSAPPYYFAPGQPELAEFYEELVPQLPLPVFLYNMPSHVKVNFAPATVKRIAQNPQVVGFKDSSANTVYFQSVMNIMQDRPDFAMLMGPEEVTGECVLLGANGGINGGANMFPELYVSMYNAAKAGNLAEVNRLQKLIMQISASIYTVGQHGSSYLKGLKCALSLLGIINDDFVAAPFHKFNEPEREKIRQALAALPIENGKLIF